MRASDVLEIVPEDVAAVDLLSSQMKQRVGTISSQSSVFFVGTLFTTVIGYAFKVYVARTLGADALGLYALGMSVVGVAAFWSGLGLAYTTVRFVSVYVAGDQKERLRRFLQICCSASFGAGVIIALVVVWGRRWLAGTVLGEPRLEPLLVLFATLVPLQSVGFVMVQALRGFEEVTRTTIITSFIAIPVKIVFTLVAFALGWALWGYVGGEIVAATLMAILLLLAVRTVYRRVPPGTHEDYISAPIGLGKEVYVYAASMMGLGLLDVIASQADKFMLGAFLDARAVGIYTVALTASAYIPTLLTSVNTIFSPIISQLNSEGNRILLEQLFQVLTKWTLGLTWPLVATVVILAPEFMAVFGPEFRTGWPILAVMGVGHLINVGVGSVGYMLMMSGKERILIFTRMVSAAITFTSYWIFIPAFGATGAGLSVALGLIVTNVTNLYLVRRHLGIIPYNRSFASLILPALLTLTVVWATRALLGGLLGYIPIILVALISSYSALVVSYAFTGLDKMDRLVLENMRERARAIVHALSRRKEAWAS